MSAPRSVTGLDDLLRWAEHNLTVTCNFLDDLLGHNDAEERLAAVMSETTMSSAFSGIGAPEQAHTSSCQVLTTQLSRRIAPGRHLFAIEQDTECQYELQMAPTKPECLFTDMLDAIADVARPILESQAASFSYADLLKIFREPNMVKERMHCLIAGKECLVKKARVHVAGTECTAFSSQGARAGTADRTRTIILFAWVAQRRMVQEDVIVHENVPLFPLSMLRETLGDIYLVEDEMSAVLDADCFGNPYNRSRRWSILVHRRALIFHPTRNAVPAWEQFAKLYMRKCSADLDIYLWMEDEHPDLEDEHKWASQRTKTLADAALPVERETEQAQKKRSSKFYLALNSVERDWVEKYEQIRPEGVCLLGQDPMVHPHCTKAANLMTVIRNPQLYWHHKRLRWMSPRELLTVHNYPTVPAHIVMGQTSCFNYDRQSFNFPPRRRLSMIRQAGNGMNVSVVDVALQFIWVHSIALQKTATVPRSMSRPDDAPANERDRSPKRKSLGWKRSSD